MTIYSFINVRARSLDFSAIRQKIAAMAYAGLGAARMVMVGARSFLHVA